MQDVRRKVLQTMGAIGGGIAAPSFYMLNASAADFRNNPGSAKTVTLGFNVPQSGPYADEAEGIQAGRQAPERRR